MIDKSIIQEVIDSYTLEQTGHERKHYLNLLGRSMQRKEIIILKGVRRCGKTTIMKQLMKQLIDDGIKKENIVYVNLDDFKFLPYLSLELLETILSTRNLIEKQYIFFDEIQKIPQFESWLRTHYDRGTNAKFIVSGSNSTLLAKDLATLLTGRNLTFEIFPLNFEEYKYFTNSDDLNNFLTYGGFPEVVLENNVEEKRNLLRNYVSDIINKDILLRRNVADQNQLVLFAQYMLENPGLRLSINKLSKQVSLSKDTVKKYIEYLIDAYLVFDVPFFSYSAKSKFIASNIPKYYVIDNGFYLVNSTRKEESRQYEAAVGQLLRRKGTPIYYWKDVNEVDFIFKNIAYNVVSSKNIPEREILGLEKIRQKHKTISDSIVISPDKETKEFNIEYMKLKTFLENHT